MIKKNIAIILSISLIVSLIFPTTIANAKSKTLQDYKNEVAALKNKKAENNRLTNESIAKIDAKRNAITNANNTISANETKVENSKVKVSESQEAIKIKNEELKDVINVLQYSEINDQEIYLDYVFSSESVSELIERKSVVEQIIEHTQKELDDLDQLIKDNESLQVKLAEDNVTLANSITTYEKQVEELEAYINSLASVGLSYDDEIKAQNNLIKLFEEAGCKNSDSVDDCYYNKKTSSSYFSRPLNSGKITQIWGNNGHKGIDIGGNAKGTSIYAPANGTVIYTKSKSSCGGNIIYAHYNVGGQAYTSEMAHLTTMYVKAGQDIKKGQVIATVGGDPSTYYYDKCTAGTHLHYAIAYGYYLGSGANGYSSWSKFQTNTKATSVYNIIGLKNQKGWTFSGRN